MAGELRDETSRYLHQMKFEGKGPRCTLGALLNSPINPLSMTVGKGSRLPPSFGYRRGRSTEHLTIYEQQVFYYLWLPVRRLAPCHRVFATPPAEGNPRRVSLQSKRQSLDRKTVSYGLQVPVVLNQARL